MIMIVGVLLTLLPMPNAVVRAAGDHTGPRLSRGTVVGTAQIATTTTLDAPSGLVFGTVTVTGHVDPAPPPQDGFIPALGFEVNGNLSGVAPIQPDGSATDQLNLPPGRYTVVAIFAGLGDYAASSSEPAEFVVGVETTTSMSSSLNPALSTQQVVLTAAVSNSLGATIDGGTLTLTDVTAGKTLGSTRVGAGILMLTVTTSLSIGDHRLTAAYSGTDTFSPSSADLTQAIVRDQAVDADSFGRSFSTFDPVKDGYRDTVAIRGVLHEPATVTIRIYSVATGKRVRLVSLGTTSGPYAWSWNGRKSSGRVLAAGKYRIVQTLVDRGNNQLSATAFVNLSRKKLSWHSGSKTLRGNQFAIKGGPGDASVSTSRSSFPGGVRLSSGHAWAAVSYAFRVPNATAYGNVSFKVQGRSPNRRRAIIAIWNPALGASDFVESYDAARLIGPGLAWYTTKASLESHKGSGKVRGMVYVENSGGPWVFDVAKVKVTYRYALLK